MGQTTNKLGLSEVFVAATESDYVKLASRSVTELNAPVRQRMLMDRYGDQITEDVADKIWMLIGNAVHYMLEKAAAEDVLTEQGFIIEVLGVKVGMTPDRVEPIVVGSKLPGFAPAVEGEWHVKDFKITSAYSVKNGIPKDDWVKQTNIYAYGLRLHGYNVTRISIETVLRDWSKTKLLQDKGGGYPQHNVAVLSVPVWSDEKCKAYIESRVKLFESCKHMSDTELPQCTEDERWNRDYGFAVVGTTGLKRAVSGGTGFKTRMEAEAFKRERDNKPKYKPCMIEYRPGKSIRCEDYCPVSRFCNQFNKEIKADPF